MKKTLHKSAAAVLLASLGVATGWAQESVPYSIDFTTTSPESSWTTVDKSDVPGTSWIYGKGGYNKSEEQVPCARFNNDENSNQDDYYVSPGIKLEAGKYYSVIVSNQCGGTQKPTSFSIEAGKSATDMSENTVITANVPFGTLGYGAYYEYYQNYALTTEAVFSPKEDGVYYFSMHATADKYENTSDNTKLFVYDFKVKEAGESLPYSIDFGKDGTTDWYAFDANETGKTWNTDLAQNVPGYGENAKIPYFQSEYDIQADDYYVSPGFLLKAGQSYAATFDVFQNYGTASYGSGLSLEVATAKDNKDAYEKVATMKLSESDNVLTTDRHVFTVKETGLYFIAAHATGNEKNNTYVYDGFTKFNLEETDEAPEYTVGGEEKPEEVTTKELPYYQNFAFEQTDWKAIDASEEANDTWTYQSFYTSSGNQTGVGIQNDYKKGNDYYVSPAFKFEAGKKYTIDMTHCIMSYGGKLYLEYGTSNSDVTKFEKLQELENTNNAPVEGKYDFTVPSDGIYYFAFHATNEGAQEENYVYTYVFDFGVKEFEEEEGGDDTPDVEGTIPYSVTFDSEDNFKTWKTLDNSDTKGSTWGWTEKDYAEKPAATIGVDSKSSICDYLISPVFELKEGKTYTITADYAAPESNQTSLIINVTQDRQDANKFNNIDWIGSGALPAKDYETDEAKTSWDFEVRKDGKYYFGFQALNWDAGTAADISIYSVNITEKEVADEVETLPYTVDFTPETSKDRDKWAAFDRSSSEIKPAWQYNSYGYQEYKIDNSQGYENWVPVGDPHPAVASGIAYDSDADIYYASPAFNLEADKTYKMTTETTSNLSCVQDGTTVFNILLGTERKIKDSYKTEIAKLPLNSVYDERKGTYEFTVEESGKYYIAFHMYNADGSKPYGYLFSFGLEEKITSGISSISSIPANAEVNVYSLDGRLAGTYANLKSLAKGTYIVTVKTDGKTQSFKVVK